MRHWLYTSNSSDEAGLCVPLSSAGLPIPPGQIYFPEVGRHILPDKVKINLNLLRGFNAALAVTLMDKDFLHKFIQHGRRQVVKILVLVN